MCSIADNRKLEIDFKSYNENVNIKHVKITNLGLRRARKTSQYYMN